MFINKLKTKLNGFQIQKEVTTLFKAMSPQKLKKNLQKFHLWARKRDVNSVSCAPSSKIVHVGSNK